MKVYVGRVRVPAVVARHAPRNWVRVAFSTAEVARHRREAQELAERLRECFE